MILKENKIFRKMFIVTEYAALMEVSKGEKMLLFSLSHLNILLKCLNRFNGTPTSPLVQMWIKTHRCLTAFTKCYGCTKDAEKKNEIHVCDEQCMHRITSNYLYLQICQWVRISSYHYCL